MNLQMIYLTFTVHKDLDDDMNNIHRRENSNVFHVSMLTLLHFLLVHSADPHWELNLQVSVHKSKPVEFTL